MVVKASKAHFDSVKNLPITHREKAELLGVSLRSFMARMARDKAARGPLEKEIQRPVLPIKGLPIEDVVNHRKEQFKQRKLFEESRKLIPIKVRAKGPIGILFFGDPHVDDDGTDLETLERHARLVRETEGLFGANVGDTTNNWVGRLARLYGNQETSAETAWRLAEWFLHMCPQTEEEWKDKPPWLFLVGGNHDLWSGSGDPLKWIAGRQGTIYEASQVRISLQFPNNREVRVNCAHDFRGSSQWNPAHGSMKAAQLGFRDHILVNGHKHTSGYGIIKDPMTGLMSHAIQVASYKIYDEYAQQLGLIDRNLSPAVLCVINPDPFTEAGLVTTFFDVDEGVQFLKWKRQQCK